MDERLRATTDAILLWLTSHGIRLALILTMALVAVWLTRRAFNRFETKLKAEDTLAGRDFSRSSTLMYVCRSVVATVVWVLAALMALGELGLDLRPLVAGAGILGIGLGFGAQSLVKDFFTGFFVLLEDQYRVGDIVEIEGVSGVVEKFTLRLTALRSIDGTLHSIPNGEIRRVSNLSSGWSKAIVDVGIAYDQKIQDVVDAVKRAGEKMRSDEQVGPLMLEMPEILGIEAFADSAMTMRLSIKTMPGKQWAVGRAFRASLKEIFDATGITIPFPTRTIIREDRSAD